VTSTLPDGSEILLGQGFQHLSPAEHREGQATLRFRRTLLPCRSRVP
jgi:hypothetical protein